MLSCWVNQNSKLIHYCVIINIPHKTGDRFTYIVHNILSYYRKLESYFMWALKYMSISFISYMKQCKLSSHRASLIQIICKSTWIAITSVWMVGPQFSSLDLIESLLGKSNYALEICRSGQMACHWDLREPVSCRRINLFMREDLIANLL